MCGVAGVLAAVTPDDATVRRMTGAIRHRGPDDGGSWIDPEAGIALGHRRLAIVDLSPHGHQPMASADGRWVISCNGEIYNHRELRAALDEAGLTPDDGWRGHSDIETLVAAIAAWGLAPALQRSVGMFAIALWDRRERRLHLVRDRFGEKPLYWGWSGTRIVFASELKAIRTLPGFANPVSRAALGMLAARTYIPAPFSIYQRIFKLQPGCILTLSAEASAMPRDTAPQPGERGKGLALDAYWSYREVVDAGAADPIVDEQEALDRLGAALAQSIEGQAVADVPVGAFLSGGIDSSTVVALYQRHASRPVRTFSMGFEEAGFNEAVYAKQVAAHFGTDHNEHYVSVSDARAVIPLLPAMYDEPFADSSQIPTFLVSRFAREQVTVALSGDGGDELFAGYNRYRAAPQLWNWLRKVPAPARRSLGSALGMVPPGVWNAGRGSRPSHFAANIRRALHIAREVRGFDDVYLSFFDDWVLEGTPVIGAPPGPGPFDMALAHGATDTDRMMYCEAVSYLPDDILCKVDRAAMAVSLETRVPFLDHRVAAVAARIPLAMKVRDGHGKSILRRLLYRHAPPALFDRPKAGFAVPVGQWLRGPLHDWAEHLLSPERLAGDGYFDAALVRARWQAHLDGRCDATSALWPVLMFQAWLDEQSGTLAA